MKDQSNGRHRFHWNRRFERRAIVERPKIVICHIFLLTNLFSKLKFENETEREDIS